MQEICIDQDIDSRPRPISRLSAEQRARERAADRASQRALRPGTQEKIDRLKQRIGELEDGAVDTPEYQALERRNLELEKELEQLKSVLDGLKADGGADSKPPITSNCT